MRPVCLHCGPAGAVSLVKGAVIYPHREDLADLNFWRCGCGAYVGCHKPGIKPLGTPANRDVHAARRAAHAAFDPLWRAKAVKEMIAWSEARQAGYLWLGQQLGLPPENCHIGLFDEVTARKVVELCKRGRSRRS